MLSIKHLESLILLARQPKKDIQIISEDGGEVFAQKLVLSIFSQTLANLFLSHDIDEMVTILIVPVNCIDLDNIVRVIGGDIKINETEFEAACDAAKILGIDLKAVISVYEQNIVKKEECFNETNIFSKFEDSPVQVYQSIFEGKELLDEASFVEEEHGREQEIDSKLVDKKNNKSYMSLKRKSDPCMIYSCAKCDFRFKGMN